MAKHNYVLSKYMSGMSKSDLELDVNQLIIDDMYEILQPELSIAEDIFSKLESFLHPQYTQDFIYSLFATTGKYKLLTYDSSDFAAIKSIVLSVDAQKRVYYYDIKGRFISRQIYEVYQVYDADMGYLVTEHIIAPEEGCDLIEHCYKPYFRDARAARQYCRSQNRQYDAVKGTENSGFKITVVDVNKLEMSAWYKAELKAWDDVERYELDKEDYRYLKDIDKIRMAILADAYDSLSEDEQAEVNTSIYEMLRKFIPEDYLGFLDEDIDNAMPDEVEEIADQAITLALVNASSEDALMNVHEILGPHEYRIGAITDEIYNNNPDSGYIVVTRGGDLGWYKSCYAINEWSGSLNNPWHGKFQQNENDVLLCFREFHPELIADKLPKKSDIDMWEQRYQEVQAVSRRKHYEMTFEKNEDGDVICIGTWYYEGVYSGKKVEEAMFFNDYGSHVFSEDECKALLNGEELVIEHFITKMDMEVTIRGKLKDVSNLFDDEQRIEFVRTDINASARKKLNSEFGFEEPGLPPAENGNIGGEE